MVGRNSLQTFWNCQNAQAMTAPPISEAKEIASKWSAMKEAVSYVFSAPSITPSLFETDQIAHTPTKA